MTLDGAIKHCEEVAEEQEKLCKRYDDVSGYSRSHNESIRVADAKWCERCAKEHRQLAEWLKDYKRLKEQESVLDKIKAEIVMYEADCRLVCDEEPCKQCTDNVFGSIYRIIDKYKVGGEE